MIATTCVRGFVKRILVASIAASLLSMPVSYTGGAESVHPHMFIQLWMDASTGTFGHHWSAGDKSMQTTISGNAGALHATSDANQHGSNAVDLASASTSPQISVADTDANLPRPLVSNPGPPDAHCLSIVLQSIGSIDALFYWQSLYFPVYAQVAGRSESPELPPPRTG